MKKFVPFIALLVLLLVVGLVGAQSDNLPGSGWTSGQQVQNVGTGNAKVTMTAYDENGTPDTCVEFTIAPGASATWLTDRDCSVEAGFQGSAVVSSDQPIVAVVNVNNVPTGEANGQYQGTDGADVSKTIVFPLVKHQHVNRTTTFYVQNASTSNNNITASFKMRDGGSYNKTYNNVPANAMVVISPSDAGVPTGTGQVGSLTVEGSQPLAGAALEHETNVPIGMNLQAVKAFTPTDFDTKAYCPLYRSKFAGQKTSTGLQVQNVDNQQRQITMKFFPRGGGAAITKSQTAAAGASVTFYAPNEGFADGSIGSVEVSSPGNIVAVVNEDGVLPATGVKTQTTYACFADGNVSAKVNVPLAKEFFLGNTTGIQVQNVGSGNATITVKYTTKAGKTVEIKNSSPTGPGASFTANQVSDNPSSITVVSGNLNDLKGQNLGVVITANQDIVAIANEVSYAGGGKTQDNKNYEGFNQ